MHIYSLISEDGEFVSLGRISFWFILGLSVYFWLFKSASEYPNTLYETLVALMLYNFGKKGLETYIQIKR